MAGQHSGPREGTEPSWLRRGAGGANSEEGSTVGPARQMELLSVVQECAGGCSGSTACFPFHRLVLPPLGAVDSRSRRQPILLAGCHHPLGLKNNSIPDKQITASSSHKTWGLHLFSWNPSCAQLDNRAASAPGWQGATTMISGCRWVDLGSPKQVTGIITQGAHNFGSIQFVASYKVAYSNDSINWTEYQDLRTGSSKIFPGNWDNHSHKKNLFEMPILAHYVRVLPLAWHNRIALHLKLLGCTKGAE
ncbi:Lactadherin [Saguinus oedipus]|uniref:Lactadherin n=1 Tax=Saguinus oedipus TaxID=9490 RepID=A0ABQ9VIY2_SAGOE|nr:Lactadherin [Saguinus oedipus]